jgi:tryptophan synthase alpha chain
MGRYEAMFEQLGRKRQGAFIPFAMLGDPDEETSLTVLESFVEGGADALELGIPFSDPVADGPTIQAAANRALAAGMTPDKALAIVSEFRRGDDRTPVGLLVYANLVAHRGLDCFYKRAMGAGVDSVLVADVPTREGQPFVDSASKHGVQPVFIAAPNSSKTQLRRVAELSAAYTYVVSRAGVTGAEDKAGLDHSELMRTLKELRAPPAVLGFGISSPEHVKQALASGASGAISGSAIVNLIAQSKDKATLKTTLIEFVSRMKAATLG